MSRDIPIPVKAREEAEKPKTAEKPATLLEAILAVQRAAPKLQKNALNKAFGTGSKYISLDALMAEVMPLVNEQDLVWLTMPTIGVDDKPALTYRLAHAPSKEAVEGTMPLMLAKTDPQGQGSAITYARRYSLMAVLGLVADEDDDGNTAASAQQAEDVPWSGEAPPVDKPVPDGLITEKQLTFLENLAYRTEGAGAILVKAAGTNVIDANWSKATAKKAIDALLAAGQKDAA